MTTIKTTASGRVRAKASKGQDLRDVFGPPRQDPQPFRVGDRVLVVHVETTYAPFKRWDGHYGTVRTIEPTSIGDWRVELIHSGGRFTEPEVRVYHTLRHKLRSPDVP